jgi:hypothetical protein
MIEMQAKPRQHYQPSRERLAFLLAQLSELDPEPEKYPYRKFDVEPERKPETERKQEKVVQMEPPAGSFHAAFRECAAKGVDELPPQRRPAHAASRGSLRPWLGLTQKGVLSQLARAFSWAHGKYSASAAKRLRLSEVVSLGDKRFVALVNVEGREFLIGGAPSGLSLLAQLGGSTESAEARPQGMSAEVRAR